MRSPFWYTFYFSIGIGVVLGALLRAGGVPISFGFFSNGISNSMKFLQLSGSDAYWLGIALAAGVILAFVIAFWHAVKTFIDAGDYALYIFVIGFFAGLLLVVGGLSWVGLVGLILLIIGVMVSYRVENAPPGTPDHSHRK